MTEYRDWSEAASGAWEGHRDTVSVAHGALHVTISNYGPGCHGTSIPLPVVIALLEANGFSVVQRRTLGAALQQLVDEQSQTSTTPDAVFNDE